MYVREKTARGHTYLYLVESEREGGGVRQRIIRALGRKDALLASGELQRLAASLVRHCDRAIILSDMQAGRIACTRIGGGDEHCSRQEGDDEHVHLSNSLLSWVGIAYGV